MNFQQLKYAVEVEKTESISKAAKKLFMGQPNLSKSIKELETEIGITLFSRSPKGVSVTIEGKEFLRYARSIVAQVEELQNTYVSQGRKWKSFTVASARTTYISLGFTNFVNRMLGTEDLHVQYRETNGYTIINLVASGEANVGILRYNVMHQDYYFEQLAENNLDYEELYTFQMQILVDKNHPLADKKKLRYEDLNSYIEVRHGDSYQVQNMDDFDFHKSLGNIIYIYDRGSQFDLLRCVKGSYMFASPVSECFLQKSGFRIIPCENAGVHKDILIFQKGKKRSVYMPAFIACLREEIQKIEEENSETVSPDKIRKIYRERKS